MKKIISLLMFLFVVSLTQLAHSDIIKLYEIKGTFHSKYNAIEGIDVRLGVESPFDLCYIKKTEFNIRGFSTG